MERQCSPRVHTPSILSLHSECTYKLWRDEVSGVGVVRGRRLTVYLHQRQRKSCSLRILPQARSHTLHFDPAGRFPSSH